MDRYDIQGRVGQGAYGTVLRARQTNTGRIVAIKKIGLSRDRLQTVRELCALRNLHHDNILALVDVFCSNDTLSIVTDFVPYHLNDVMLDPRRPKTDEFIRFFYHQILLAIDYMHSVNIMHRDLKPENILITRSLLVRIADFGQACLYIPEQPDREYEENVATRWYRAPELLFASRKYTPSVDIWSLGCVLSAFLLDGPIFQGRTDLEQISKIFSVLGTPVVDNWPSFAMMPDACKVAFDPQPQLSDWNAIVRGGSPDYIDFLRCHLRLDGGERSSANFLLEHPFLAGPRETPTYRILKRNRESGQRRMPLLNRR